MCLYLAGLITALLMLQSIFFGKLTAIIGIIASSFGLGYFFTTAFVPSLNIVPAVGSAPFNLIWYILIGIKLIKITRQKINNIKV